MAKSPTGIVPESMMTRGSILQVIALLQGIPIPGDDKVEYFRGWAKAVGVKVSASQVDAVRYSGSDQQ